MSDRYLPLSITILRVGRELPLDVWNSQGVLLLAKGQRIETLEQLRTLASHRPMMRQADYQQLGAQMQGWLLQSGAQSVLPSTAPLRATAAPVRRTSDPALAWPELQDHLARVLHQGLEADAFLARVDEVDERLESLARFRADDSLFMLLQHLQHGDWSYSATHALLCALVCDLVGEPMGLAEDERASLRKAALTMNIGMSRLHDHLAEQKRPPDRMQREHIADHPGQGVQILRELGVQDPLWLQLVADHHETLDGQGYPSGKTDLSSAQQLLHLADVFASKVSPRVRRPPMAPLVAVRSAYLQSHDGLKAMGEAFVRAVGLYPPGSYVKLSTQEVAVVMRRGSKATEPTTLVVLNSQGMPVAIPPVRRVGQHGLEVVASLSADQINIRLDPARLLKRLQLT